MSYQSNALEQHGTELPVPLQAGIDPYIARTYRYFFTALASMAVLGFISYHLIPRSSMTALSAADCILWVLCGWLGWRRPVALTFPLFSLITGLLLGQLAHLYAPVFLSASVLTLFAFGGLSAYVHLTKHDFSFLRGFLCIAFFVLLGGMVLACFFHQPLFLLGWTGFGVVTFGCWILFDTSQIIHRADGDLTPGIAAFELILDLIGFHRWLLDHLSVWIDLD
jgi:FtsH-binding integral membrane protein